MKTVKEIRKLINKLREEINNFDKREKEINEEIKNIINGAHFSVSDEKAEKVEALRAERDLLYSGEAIPNKLIRIWRYNLTIAFKAEFMPIFSEVMTKYQGKNIGEKTKEKIRAEFKARGLSVYYYQEYSRTTIGASYLDDYYNRFEFYAYNAPIWDDNGKFTIPDLNGFKFNGETVGYIENPKQYIKNLEKLAVKLHETAGAYSEAMKKYNRYAIPGTKTVEYQNSPESIYSYFRVWNF